MPVDTSQILNNTLANPSALTTPNLGFSGGVSGILDLINGVRGTDLDHSQTVADIADPFRSQRPQYQAQLQNLLTNPGSFTMDPGAIFARDQGLEGVARHGNAMFGTTRAGNTAVELDKFATGFAGQQFNTRINQLLTLSGATTGSPAAAGQAVANGYANRNQSIAGGLRGLDNILSALGITPASLANMGAQGVQLLKGIFGDTSANDYGGNVNDFLTHNGIDPSSLSQGGQNILDPSGTSGLTDSSGILDGTVPSSVDNILGGGPGGFGDTSGFMTNLGDGNLSNLLGGP